MALQALCGGAGIAPLLGQIGGELREGHGLPFFLGCGVGRDARGMHRCRAGGNKKQAGLTAEACEQRMDASMVATAWRAILDPTASRSDPFDVGAVPRLDWLLIWPFDLAVALAKGRLNCRLAQEAPACATQKLVIANFLAYAN